MQVVGLLMMKLKCFILSAKGEKNESSHQLVLRIFDALFLRLKEHIKVNQKGQRYTFFAHNLARFDSLIIII